MNSANLQLEKSDSTVERAEAFQQTWILVCFGWEDWLFCIFHCFHGLKESKSRPWPSFLVSCVSCRKSAISYNKTIACNVRFRPFDQLMNLFRIFAQEVFEVETTSCCEEYISIWAILMTFIWYLAIDSV